MEKDFVCNEEIIHNDIVEKIKSNFPQDDIIEIIADFYKIFGDATRFKILYSIKDNELCVCDISALLNMTISAVSHHLQILRYSNLVKTRKDGKTVYYSLADKHVTEVIECGISHVDECFRK